MKRCPDCEATKPLDDFPVDRARRDGRYPYCRDCQRIRVARARKKRLEHHNAKAREYANAHREQRTVVMGRWRDANRDRAREINREWYARNARAERSRARAANLVRRGVLTTADDRDYATVLLGDPCSYCGGAADSIDHIVPIAAGPDGHWSNLTGACRRCNSKKGSQSLLHVGVTGLGG